VKPDVRFARNGEYRLAYQIVGDGTRDLLYLPMYASNLEWLWEYEPYARFLEGLASFSRVILMDKRGWGCSDRLAPNEWPPIEDRLEDIDAVLDDAGSTRAVLFGGDDSGFLAVLAAAARPERVSRLVLFGAAPTYMRTEDTPWDYFESASDFEQWGTRSFAAKTLRAAAPSALVDDDAVRWFTTLCRLTCGVGSAIVEEEAVLQTDVRDVLPAISAPALVLHRAGDRYERIENARYLAEHIPNATLVELPGEDHFPWWGDQAPVIDAIGRFTGGAPSAPDPTRTLATVMFTDVVGSTERAAELGDGPWRELIGAHDRIVRDELEKHGGKEIKTLGDGFLAMFDGPARATRCALAIAERVRELGIQVRAGVPTGEVEVVEGDLAGVAVHIGSRVTSLAGPSEVLVSSTVRDLVAGSGLVFEDAGEHELKGIAEPWRLYRALP